MCGFVRPDLTGHTISAVEKLVPSNYRQPKALHKARFVREAKAAARLDHQNICPVYEIDEADGHTFIAMAYLEGQTLKDKIADAFPCHTWA